MKILSKRRLDIPKRYIYLSALLFSFVVLLQIFSAEEASSLIVSFRHVVLFVSIYAFWALTIDFIYALIAPFTAGESRISQIIVRLINATLLVLVNLIVSNLLYYAYLSLTTDFVFAEAYKDIKPFILKSVIIRFVDIFVICAILKVIEINKKVQDQNLQVITLENQLHLSQLEALRNQLDPHFLFNSLHTLNTLIGYDDEKAQAMVIKITNLLRKILDKRQQQMITFEEELDYFTSYLEIEEERFHDRLEVDIAVDENTKDQLVPTLMLQPLIENAFKHGIALLENKGKIELNAQIRDHIFSIRLSNSINTEINKKVVNSTKIGLENLNKRLKQTFGNDYLFTTNRDQGMFTAIIKIKLETIK